MFKFNNRGEYTYFPGVTIISAVDPEQINVWKQVHQCITTCELALAYYTPLPYQSYHMTTLNLFVEALLPKALSTWGSFLRSKRDLFRELDQFCKQNQFIPEIEVIDINVSSSLRLHVRLPEHQANLINLFARQFNLTAGMPNVLHMTLAYNYNKCSTAIKQHISDQLTGNLYEIFESYPEKLRLLTPTLNYFRDMTAFVPWDGQDYPFLTERPLSPAHHGSAAFFQPTTAEASLVAEEGSCPEIMR